MFSHILLIGMSSLYISSLRDDVKKIFNLILNNYFISYATLMQMIAYNNRKGRLN